jgi:hypothetical protein
LEAVPAGRLHLTVRSGLRAGELDVVTRAGEVTSARVRLEKGGGVSGRLVDEKGAPVSGWVGIVEANDEERAEPMLADDTGRFVLSPVAPGRHVLRAQLGRTLRVEVPVEVRPGEILEAGDVVLRARK